MSAEFCCNNKECKKAFYFDVPDEIMIDESNMAVFYCPHCSGTLMRSLLTPNFSKYKITKDKIPNNNNI